MPRRARAAGSAVTGFCVLLVPVPLAKDPLQLPWCQGGNLNCWPGRVPLSLPIRCLLCGSSLELAVATEPKSRKALKKKKGEVAKAFSPPKVALRVLEAKIAVGMVQGRAACPVVLLSGSKRIKFSVLEEGLLGGEPAVWQILPRASDIALFSGVEASSHRSAWILAQRSQCSRLWVILSQCWISLWSLPGWLLRSGHASMLGSSAWICPACSTLEWRAIIAVSSRGLLLKKCKLLFQPEATRRSQFLNSVFILFLSSTVHHPKEAFFFFFWLSRLFIDTGMEEGGNAE